jgi:murein DD-endopeptidase MepM/ murein hydrolase activator NlpD
VRPQPRRECSDPGPDARTLLRMSPRLRTVALLASLLLALAVPLAAAADVVPHRGGAWPLAPEPEVVTTFDPPPEPWRAGHRGVDLLGRPGQVVRSALAGRVVHAGVVAGTGVVSVRHPDGTRTTYQPVAADVRAGAEVAAGGHLGVLLLAGSHCFPRACLHWGHRRGRRTYLDPLALVGATRVRLLPWWSERPDEGGRSPGTWFLTRGGAPAGTPAAAGPW